MSDKIKKIIRFMQSMDANGMWDEIEQDIKDGNTTLEKELLYIAETLKNWKDECTTAEQAELIREYLKEIKEIYNM
jgi:hypothetical protein